MDTLARFLVYYQVLAFALIPLAVLVILLPSAEKRWPRGCGVVNLAVALVLLLCVANALRDDIAAHKYAVASLPRSVYKTLYDVDTGVFRPVTCGTRSRDGVRAAGGPNPAPRGIRARAASFSPLTPGL